MLQESESQTRKRHIDVPLTASPPPWKIIPYQDGLDMARLYRVAALFAPADRLDCLSHSIIANTFHGTLLRQDPTAQTTKLLVRNTNQRSMIKRDMQYAP
jgi:hypothetical protein